jgi:hypothetical protein
MMVSTKLHMGVNFWIQGALCASHRLELTRRWFVILNGPPAIDKETGWRSDGPAVKPRLFVHLSSRQYHHLINQPIHLLDNILQYPSARY